MAHTLLAGSLGAMILALGLFAALERPSWLPLVGREPEPVLIFLVGHRAGVERVRRAVDPSRLVVDTPDAFALVEGRMVATDAAAVSEPLMAAGWGDRELEMFALPRQNGRDRSSREGRDGAGAEEARMSRLMELINQPTLTEGEALFVLQAMNDGLLLE